MRVCPGCGRETSEERCAVDGLVTLEAGLLERKDAMIGRTLAGRYHVEARLGAGGFGAVYRARHRETGGAVAVKVLHRDGADDADAVKRFSLEAQNAAALTSAHTVRVLDFGVDDETLFLVMELLDGEPLDARLRRGPLPWREAALITSHVLDALAEAHEHERRIVHRDIKAPNVFLCRTRLGRVHAKVIDFGIARALEGTGAGTRGAIGTPHAMAPEQWRGDAIDGRTDLYALGALLYEMLSGRPPFEARQGATPSERMMQLARAHVGDLPPPLGLLAPPGVPATLVALVHRLLEKEPRLRPASAREVLSALDGLLAAASSSALTLDETVDAGAVSGMAAVTAVPDAPGPPDQAPAPPSQPADIRRSLAARPASTPAPAPARAHAPPAQPPPGAVAPPPAPDVPIPLVAGSPPQLAASPPQLAASPPRRRSGAGVVILLIAAALAVGLTLVVGGGLALRFWADEAAGGLAADPWHHPPPPPAAPSSAGLMPASQESQVAALEAAVEAGLRYRARLSQADHQGPDGAPLTAPWQVLVRDRQRAAAGQGEAEDGALPLPVELDGAALAELAAAFAGALSEAPAVAAAIAAGTPLIDVIIGEDGVQLQLVAP